MKSTVENVEGLSHTLKIEVPAEKVTETFTKIYSGIQRSANIKGFRQGKAPMSTVKSLYGDKVSQEALQNLVGESYEKALDEHSLEPITQPHIDIQQFGENKDFVFTAKFEIRPEVSLAKVEGLEVEQEKLSIEEDRIQEVLEKVRSNFKETAPVLEDRAAKSGDVAKIDFEGFVESQPLEGAKAEDHELELGSNTFIPGFEDGIEGMKVGAEKTLTLKFPDDYHAPEIKGKDVVFNVKLKSLHKYELPEVDDALAKKVGEHFESLDALKTAIKEDIERSESKRIKDDLKDRVLKALAAANPLEVPQALIHEQKHRLIHDVEHRLKSQGLDDNAVKEYQEKWDKDISETAAHMVRSSFLIDAVAKKFDLKPSSSDLDDKMKEMAQQMNLEFEKVKEYYGSDERRSTLSFQVMEEKVIDFLLGKAKVTEVDAAKLSAN